MRARFDYEKKIWGFNKVGLAPIYLGALRLKYCLADLKEVKGRVLEVGCGGGAFCRAIADKRDDLEVWGGDISEKAIKNAKSISKPAINYVLSDAEELPFKDGQFEAVLMFDLLEHLDNPQKALKEACRVLRRGGILHIYVPLEGDILTLHGILARLGFKPKEKYGGHIQRYTRKGLRKLLRDSGFTIEEWRYHPHLISQIIDFGYYSFLALIGRNIPSSLESKVTIAKPGFGKELLRLAIYFVAIISYLESFLLAKVPGLGVSTKCQK